MGWWQHRYEKSPYCCYGVCQALLKDGFKPERDVYLLFGDNEEVVANDKNGAHDLMTTLKERGIRLDSVIDEGGAIIPINVPGVLNDKYLVGVGVAEKGYSDIEIVVNAKGGHGFQLLLLVQLRELQFLLHSRFSPL